VFCDYNFTIIIFAVLELWLIQHYLNCEQFFFYIIVDCAVHCFVNTLKYHLVTIKPSFNVKT